MEQQTMERPRETISQEEYREIPRQPTPAQIYLQPIASPWSLGMLGFAVATFVIGANMAGWYGTRGSQTAVFPFILMLGGLAQLLASSWGFRARDLLATAFFGIWGAVWFGYGIQLWLFASGVVTTPIGIGTLSAYSVLFFALAAITLSCSMAALAENVAVFSTIGVLTAASIVLGIGEVTGSVMTLSAGGILLVISALIGWYTATAQLLEYGFNRAILPVGEFQELREPEVLDEGLGEPGVVRYHRAGSYRYPHRPLPQT